MGSAGTAQRGLALRHFALQGDKPPHLADVDLGELEPALRSLLLTDGTVTRALEAQLLASVSVSVIEQESTPLSDAVASQLDARSGEASVRRLVKIGLADGPAPLIWAESHILPERLPDDFLRVLDNAPEGIGESLQQVRLESCRDLLWFGFDAVPAWSGVTAGPSACVITRCYRVTSGARPCLLIAESFTVEQRDGAYRLGWPA
ncbi:MAG TPA: chorismate pyruvate-lyase family protein [Solirubrobacterales bacterium]|nr:chorismate pyruvate-lyase family protein [Solirubrobacterales bacterium]